MIARKPRQSRAHLPDSRSAKALSRFFDENEATIERAVRNFKLTPIDRWTVKIIGPNPIKFMVKHDSWPRAALVSAATLHSRRRFMTAVLEQCLVWPSDDLLNELFGWETQIGWKAGLIGKLLDEARIEFNMEAGK